MSRLLIREGWADLFSALTSICFPPRTDRLDMFVQLATVFGVAGEIMGVQYEFVLPTLKPFMLVP
jgi:hypothetical protein